jgi:hypothetical protein
MYVRSPLRQVARAPILESRGSVSPPCRQRQCWWTSAVIHPSQRMQERAVRPREPCEQDHEHESRDGVHAQVCWREQCHLVSYEAKDAKAFARHRSRARAELRVIDTGETDPSRAIPQSEPFLTYGTTDVHRAVRGEWAARVLQRMPRQGECDGDHESGSSELASNAAWRVGRGRSGNHRGSARPPLVRLSGADQCAARSISRPQERRARAREDLLVFPRSRLNGPSSPE